MMTWISFYLIFLLTLEISFLGILQGDLLPAWFQLHQAPLLCTLSGGLGGIIYCFRGIYLNTSVKKKWDSSWTPWYFLRPIVSLCCGFVSYIFLKAGLLILEANLNQGANLWGFYALAFIAGFNVDNFLKKIEKIALSTWGIGKSKTSNFNQKNEE